MQQRQRRLSQGASLDPKVADHPVAGRNDSGLVELMAGIVEIRAGGIQIGLGAGHVALCHCQLAPGRDDGRVAAGRAPELGELFLTRGPDQTRQALASYLNDQVVSGRLDLDNPREAAGMFMGMLLGEWHIDALLGRDLQLDEAQCNARAQRCLAIFLAGVSRPPT